MGVELKHLENGGFITFPILYVSSQLNLESDHNWSVYAIKEATWLSG